MKFKGNLTSFNINVASYRRAIHEELSEEIARLASVWLEAVLAEIPTWSGASRATFLQLSHAMGYSLSIDPVVTSRISFGQRHGTGKMTADAKKGLYTFEYTTDLKHLVHNEFNSPESDPNVFYRLKKPGPYNFQIKGRAAFMREVSSVRIPSPLKHLKKTKLRI